MEERFKFRAWLPAKSKMYYDVECLYDPSSNSQFAGIESDSFASLLARHTAPFDEDERIILMQSTGLRDKNGKLIYEGDIIQVVDIEDKSIAQVVWDKTYALFGKIFIGKEYEPLICRFNKIDSKIFEVIGNIYENPELLTNNKGE